MKIIINALKILVVFLIGAPHSFAQQGLKNEIMRLTDQGVKFELHESVFQISTNPKTTVGEFFNSSDHVSYVEYDPSILNNQNPFVSMEIPYNGTSLILDLIDVSEQFNSISVEVIGDQNYTLNEVYKHYRGVVRGENLSLVAISFFEDNVLGIVSIDGGNINIVRLKNSEEYIIYNDKDLESTPGFLCDMDSSNFEEYDPAVLLADPESGSNANSHRCVRLYFETEHDVFLSLGTVANVQNYVTGLYNNVATIFLNEGIETSLSEIFVWTVPDPYTVTTNMSAHFFDYQSQLVAFNGDLGQLLTFDSLSTIAGRADFDMNGLCHPNTSGRLSAISQLKSIIVPFPTYSHEVQISSHEFGHLFGSDHTHSCIWNGNNTAIDGCGTLVGSCSSPGYPPPGGGTIMSYCDARPLPVPIGISFNLGFGPQPGNVIRDRYNNANCLTFCCPDQLVITDDVLNLDVDHRQAASTITAYNTINAGGEAVYHAGDEVLLLDDFTAVNGSIFRAYIEGCSHNFEKSAQPDLGLANSEPSEEALSEMLKLSPNPTRGEFTIDLTASQLTWNKSEIELYDLKGQRINLDNLIEMRENTFKVNIAHLEKGVYVIKLVNSESNESYVKRIVKL